MSAYDWDKVTPVNAARKTHQCWECHRDIEKGDSYLRVVGSFDGNFYNCKCHPDCRDAANDVMGDNPSDYMTDGWLGLCEELVCNWSFQEAQAKLANDYPHVWMRLKDHWRE